MIGMGRGRSGKGRGRGNIEGRANNPSLMPTFNQSSLTHSHPITIREPGQRTSVDTQLSMNVEDSMHPSSMNVTNGGASCSITKKRGRGSYKSMKVDMKTKYGGKIIVDIPDDIDRVVGEGARDIVNYCGLVVRTTVSFLEGDWPTIFAKHGQTMWLKVKDKFKVGRGRQESVLQAFAINTTQRLFRAWKTRLHKEYLLYNTDEERLSHRPESVSPMDWEYLVSYFGSTKFKSVSAKNKSNREKQTTKHSHSCGSKSFAEVEESTKDPQTGKKATADIVWELQHTRKNDKGELLWSDPQSQEVHGRIQALVTDQQQLEENANPMTGDEILATVLGERTGYVRGKGYGKRPPRKNHMQQADVEASVSSAMTNVRQEMQAEMDHKLQEEREKIREEMDKIFQEQMREEVDKRIKEQMADIMSRMQQDFLRIPVGAHYMLSH
ncbi:hypothetical protein KY285_023741 [Solanum tuberosum]|nr:hypothetical protein KY285_023741 [Solanum tuberosum]